MLSVHFVPGGTALQGRGIAGAVPGDSGVGYSVACACGSLCANPLHWQQANPPAAGEAAARLSSLHPQGRALVLMCTSPVVGEEHHTGQAMASYRLLLMPDRSLR